MSRKLRLIGVLATIVGVVGLAQPAFAVDVLPVCDTGGSGSTVCADRSKSQSTSNNSLYGPNGALTKATGIIAIIGGIAAVLVIVASGIRMTLANGDSNAIAGARNAMIYAVVGLLVIILARSIIVFVFSKL